MTKNKYFDLLAAIIFAYMFAMGVRFVYIAEVANISQFYWQNQLMINNVDGYYFAEGARDIINGKVSSYLSPVHAPLSILTAYIAKFFHIPLDVLIFYMPGIFGSLIVVPLILIGKTLENIWVGFLSALLAGIAWSYYHRTMFGYYDTDMFTVVLPTFVVFGVVLAFLSKNKKYFLIAPFFEILMIKWHSGLFNIANGIFIMSAVYLLYIKFIKKEKIINETMFLVFLIIPLLPINVSFKFVILLMLYGAMFKFDVNRYENIQMKFFTALIAIYITIIGLPWIVSVLKNSYFTRSISENVDNIKYYSVVNTVREAGHINYDVFVHRISGSWGGFILGVIGYVLLIIRYPVMVVSLPMVVLGFFALRGGLRFTIFAVPFMALGNAYLFWKTAENTSRFFINDKISLYSKYVVSLLLMLGVIYPNYQHVYKYVMPSTFNNKEVAVLDKLKNIGNSNDYVLTWWDYGYPIRYYARKLTFVDGGKHEGNVNYPISFALTRTELASYNMAVLDLFFTEKHRKDSEKFDILKDIKNYYHLKSVDEIEEFLSQKIPLPKVKQNIYYYLPLRMLNIYPTVALFSYIDIHTGKIKKTPFFILTSIRGVDKKSFLLTNGIRLLFDGNLVLGREKLVINTFVTTYYDRNNKFKINKQLISLSSNFYVIWMKSYNKVLILDKDLYNSAYIQMFVLENYDKSLFKPVILTPWVKVYKLRKKEEGRRWKDEGRREFDIIKKE